MADAIHAERDGNNVDAFSDVSDIILNIIGLGTDLPQKLPSFQRDRQTLLLNVLE